MNINHYDFLIEFGFLIDIVEYQNYFLYIIFNLNSFYNLLLLIAINFRLIIIYQYLTLVTQILSLIIFNYHHRCYYKQCLVNS
jgi:hypothetical protein